MMDKLFDDTVAIHYHEKLFINKPFDGKTGMVMHKYKRKDFKEKLKSVPAWRESLT